MLERWRALRWLLVICFAWVAACGGSGRGPSGPEARRADDVLGAKPAARFSIDYTGLAPLLANLSVEERGEQLADWVVTGTLTRRGRSDPDALRALVRQPLRRDPLLEVLVPYDYGRGRYAALSGDHLLLFVGSDDPRPRVTLARVADRARAELGRVPSRVEVFVYRIQEGKQVIEVDEQGEIPGAALFTSDYGYVERRITSPGDIDAWLKSADDLTYVERRADGVVLGGRRFAEARTPQVQLEDVSALYHGHVTALGPWLEAQRLQADAHSIESAFNGAIAAFNEGAHRANAGQPLDCAPFDAALQRLQQATKGAIAARPPSCANRSTAEIIEAQAAALDELRPQAVAAIEGKEVELRNAFGDTAIQLGPAPGFSLDPRWDVAGVVRDLELLKRDPTALVARARALAGRAPSGARRGTSHGIDAALALMETLDARGSDELGALDASVVDAIDGVIAEARLAGTPSVEQLVVFERLCQELSQSSHPQGEVLADLLRFIEGENRIQCARYEGELAGTSAGMTLFYTDLLGKLWAGLDYQGAAPSAKVPGFPTLRDLPPGSRAGGTSTRIWFGVRADRISRTEDLRQIHFAPTVARVYSAASSLVEPGREAIPTDGVRHVLDWWTHHFEEVAAVDGQFHLQNQLQKWSLVTHALAEAGVLPAMGEVPVRRDLRLDRWVVNTPGVALPSGVGLVAESRWIGEQRGWECMDLLASTRREGSVDRILSGGVTLAGPGDVAVVPTEGVTDLTPLANSPGKRFPVQAALDAADEAFLYRAMPPEAVGARSEQRLSVTSFAKRAGDQVVVGWSPGTGGGDYVAGATTTGKKGGDHDRVHLAVLSPDAPATMRLAERVRAEEARLAAQTAESAAMDARRTPSEERRGTHSQGRESGDDPPPSGEQPRWERRLESEGGGRTYQPGAEAQQPRPRGGREGDRGTVAPRENPPVEGVAPLGASETGPERERRARGSHKSAGEKAEPRRRRRHDAEAEAP